MKLFEFLLPFGTVALSSELWTKCTAPCGTGEQALLSDVTVKRGCNFENCDAYDKLNLLIDGRMNDPTAWSAGSSAIEHEQTSYDGSGFYVSERAANYASIQQDHVCSEWRLLKFENLLSKVFLKFDGEHGEFEVVPRIQVSGEVNGDDYTSYLDFASFMVPVENGVNNEWHEIDGKVNFDVNKDLKQLRCRYLISVRNPTVSYHVDHVYLFGEPSLTEVMPGGFNVNGGFELKSESVFMPYGAWSVLQNAISKVIASNEAPEGYKYLQVTNRKNNRANIEQMLILPHDFDADTLIEFRYWAKFAYANNEPSQVDDREAHHNNFFTKLTIQHYIDGESESYTLQCHKACMIPDNQWRQYHATCNIMRKTWDKKEVKTLGEIENVSIWITGPNAHIEIGLDHLRVDYYKRTRHWVSGADLRIRELRTEQVNIVISGEKPVGSQLRITMTDNHFPFGGKFGMDQYNNAREEWKYYFNYGYCTNEMKWQATEKVKGVRNYKNGDKIRELFDEWSIPLSGNTLLWEVDNKATPDWYQEEFNAYIEAGESPEPLSENILFHIKDTVRQYKGKNTNYKVFNEPTHGDGYRSNYDDIWNRVINTARETDPNVKLLINDYDNARADMGQCLIDLVEGYDIDYLGVQSHMKEGFNAEIVNERLDQMAMAGHRLIITEFDSSHYDLSERAKDVEDFLRLTYSHPAVDQIITWYYAMEDTSYSAFFFDDQVLFERELNENSTDFVHLGYPWYPNEAGVAWIKLVKEKWTGDETIELDSSVSSETISRHLFNGAYLFELIGPNGESTGLDTIITNENCQLYSYNQVPGEFDDAKLDQSWIITYADYDLNWDGFMYNGLLISNRQGSSRDIQLELIGKLDPMRSYLVQLYAKLLSDFVPNQQQLTVVDQSLQVVAVGTFSAKNEWIMIESTVDLVGINTAGVLSFKTPNYTGDLIIDHVLVAESFRFDECIRQVNLSF